MATDALARLAPVTARRMRNGVIEDVLRFVFNPATVQRIQVETHLQRDLPKVWGDADMIKQVLSFARGVEGKRHEVRITDDSGEVLTGAVPKDADAVEAWMAG